MTALTLTFAALLTLILKLATSKEVRAIGKVVGSKEVKVLFPPEIQLLHKNEDNTTICNNYFYSRLIIRWTFSLSVFALMAALILSIFGPHFFDSSMSNNRPPKLVIEKANLDQVKWPGILSSEDGKNLQFTSLETETPHLAVIINGNIEMLRPLSSERSTFVGISKEGQISRGVSIELILNALLYTGILSALVCSLASGRIRAQEEADD